MKKILVVVFSLILIQSCTFIKFSDNVIIISGSDTMYQLNENLAKQFMIENPDVSVYVKGGGTSLGVKDLINNRCDIAAASRNLKPEESKLLAEYYGSLALIYLIAKDGLSIYVNPNNIVNDLTLEQIKNIFSGRITNWKEVGGDDKEIIVASRNQNSGTFLFFKEHVLEGEDFAKNSTYFNSTKEITQFVSNNIYAIGYGGVGYSEKVIQIRVNGVFPSEQNIRNDTYPITRYLHYFTRKEPTGNIKKFINWVLSPSGQLIMTKSGFISLWEYRL